MSAVNRYVQLFNQLAAAFRCAPTPPAVTDEQILQAISSWMLACAVGALNGSSGWRYGYNSWFDCCRNTWVLGVCATMKVTPGRVQNALLHYATQHQSEHYTDTLRRENQMRGEKTAMVLGPGESATRNLTLRSEPYRGKKIRSPDYAHIPLRVKVKGKL